MFNKFTDTSRRVVVLAQEQSRELGHGYIGAEHLLLGIASLDSGPAHDALDRCGVRFAPLQAATRALAAPASKPPGNHVPFTKVAKHVLEDSLRRVVALGHDEIRPEHLLLSLLNQAMEPGSTVGSLLRGLGVEPQSVIEALASDQDVVRPSSGDSDDRTPGLQAADARAKRLAGRGKTGTHHLLAAFLAEPGTAAHAILAAGGFDEGRLPNPPAIWNVAGTSDDTPEGRAERALRIDVTDEGVTIRINDPAVVKLLSAADDDGERAPETILAELLGPLFASPAAPTPDERPFTLTIDDAADPEAMATFIREQIESQGIELDPETLARLLEKIRSLRDAPPDDVA